MEQMPDELDEVRRLMALKRHETPPPGYFRNFSAGVIGRIEREESRRSARWWDGIRGFFAGRPALVGANALIGAGIGLVAVAGIYVHHAKTAGETAVYPQRFAPANAGMDPSPWMSSGLLANDRPYRTDGVHYQVQFFPVDPAQISNRLPASIIAPPDLPVMPVHWNGWR